jgi:CheY-like chemotaxis protein
MSFVAEILIVDDDEFIAAMLELRLSLRGHKVHVAQNGRDGVERALALLPDLVLMDMQMPLMGGLEAVTLLREKMYSGTIASLSASAMPADKKKAIDVGCDACITKPIDRDFEDLISDILGDGND